MAGAVEEGLRRRTPAIGVFRAVKRDVTVSGVTIPAGARAWLALASSGHDEAVYPDPGRFDVTRAGADKHLSFGKGRHLCMGAPLVRTEAPVGLSVLYERLPDLRVVPGQLLEYDPVLLSVMIKRLEVTW